MFYRILLKQSDESISIVTMGDGLSQARLHQHYGGGVEGFVISGSAALDGIILKKYDWFRLPPGAAMDLVSSECTLYLKENNVSKLRSMD